MQDPRPSDLSLDEGRYVRLPIKALWFLFGIWALAVWSYADLRAEINQTKKTAESTSITVTDDHRTLMLMHDDLLKLSDFVDESKRVYNRYFRDYNDPEYNGPRKK